MRRQNHSLKQICPLWWSYALPVCAIYWNILLFLLTIGRSATHISSFALFGRATLSLYSSLSLYISIWSSCTLLINENVLHSRHNIFNSLLLLNSIIFNSTTFRTGGPGFNPLWSRPLFSTMSLGKTDSPSSWVRSLGLCTICHH